MDQATWIGDALRWIGDTTGGRFTAVMTLLSSLGTLWISNRYADRRDQRTVLQQQESEKGQFMRQVLCDLQDAVSEDHLIALQSSHERSTLTQHGLQGKVVGATAERAGIIASRIRNLAARVDSEEIRETIALLRDLHDRIFVSTVDHPEREAWRVSALDTKEKLDDLIRTQLFPSQRFTKNGGRVGQAREPTKNAVRSYRSRSRT